MTLFENLNEMHNNDIENKTSFLWTCWDFVGARTNKRWWIVEMWVPWEVVTWIATDKYIPLLLIIDAKEYDRIMKKNK